MVRGRLPNPLHDLSIFGLYGESSAYACFILPDNFKLSRGLRKCLFFGGVLLSCLILVWFQLFVLYDIYV